MLLSDVLQELSALSQTYTFELKLHDLQPSTILLKAESFTDRIMDRLPAPQTVHLQVDILCNDCLQRSRVRFHVVGLRCASCRSYNTRRIAVDRGSS